MVKLLKQRRDTGQVLNGRSKGVASAFNNVIDARGGVPAIIFVSNGS